MVSVLIADDSAGDWSLRLEAALQKAGETPLRFAVHTLEIRPCTACGSCSSRTFGRCVLPDDMQQLLPQIAACSTLILLSPIRFGGVSYRIKRVLDRMSALGDPRYHVRDGELVKGMRIRRLSYYLVGINSGTAAAERSAFLFLHEENRRIMDVQGRAFILADDCDGAAISAVAEAIARG